MNYYFRVNLGICLLFHLFISYLNLKPEVVSFKVKVS